MTRVDSKDVINDIRFQKAHFIYERSDRKGILNWKKYLVNLGSTQSNHKRWDNTPLEFDHPTIVSKSLALTELPPHVEACGATFQAPQKRKKKKEIRI